MTEQKIILAIALIGVRVIAATGVSRAYAAGGLMGLVAHGSQDVYLNNENKLQSEINNLQSEENKLKSEVDSLQSEVNEMKSGSNNGSDSNTR